MGYIPHTESDRAAMLATIGIDSAQALFDSVPADQRHPTLDLPPPLSELEASRLLRELGALNADLGTYTSFLGAGAYRHYIPSVVPHVTGRSEFYTAYTPYQPEISQGTLQTIYEYQSMICALTGMDVANASMYDGASALAEAIIMATAITGRSRAVVAGSIHPDYRETAQTYLSGRGVEFVETAIPIETGAADHRLSDDALSAVLDDTVACLCVQQPNFLGAIEDLAALADSAHARGVLLVVSVNPIALGLLASPGALGADIVVGEGQPLGIPLSYGGPYLGIFAARERFVRQMPGRIVGETRDLDGRRAFVLTLQTREQHIRRERATSNICTNQALCALAATAYLATLGKNGLRHVAELCLQKAHYAADRIDQLPGWTVNRAAPFFHEFIVYCPLPVAAINRRLLADHIVGGFDLGRALSGHDRAMLVCVTETATREDIDRFVAALARAGQES